MSGSHELGLNVQDLLAPLEGLALRRFFGGWALTYHGHQFAIIMDALYLRVDDNLRRTLAQHGSTAFSYQSGDRRVLVERYYSAPPEALEQPDELLRLARLAIATSR